MKWHKRGIPIKEGKNFTPLQEFSPLYPALKMTPPSGLRTQVLHFLICLSNQVPLSYKKPKIYSFMDKI